MANESNLTGAKQEAFIRHLERQGARVRKTKKGLLITAPKGGTASIHTTLGDWRASRNDIASLRRIGLHHPEDKREIAIMVDDKPAEPEYPKYMTQPITSTTRKQILAALEERGWPVRIMARELPMESSVATRALYNVGYRYDPEFGKTTRNQLWAAPADIIELHEKSKAEMKRREEEALARRRAMHALESTPTPTVPTPLDVARAAERIEPPTPDAATEATEFIEENTAHAVPPTPKREFIDSVESWTIQSPPPEVAAYLDLLYGAGLDVEIRVWRRPTPEGKNA